MKGWARGDGRVEHGWPGSELSPLAALETLRCRVPDVGPPLRLPPFRSPHEIERLPMPRRAGGGPIRMRFDAVGLTPDCSRR